MQRSAYIKAVTQQDTSSQGEEHDHYSAAGPVGDIKVDPTVAAEEALKALQAAIKKEDDDFFKLEAAFLAELGEVNPNAPKVTEEKGKPGHK